MNFYIVYFAGQVSFARPCIRLVRVKFELTNQDSAGGESCTVLTSMCVKEKGAGVGQLLLTGDGIEYPRKGIENSENYIRL